MKTIYLLIILFLGMAITRCADPGSKVIERPVYGLQNTKTLEIDKIVLNDTATILYIDAYFYPGNWIRIDSATYIQADGKKYIITGSDSIGLNKEFWMPESGEHRFTLFFPPLPKGTKTIDFIESDCDNCFKIWDIDLTGKSKAYQPDLPDNVLSLRVGNDYKLPEPVIKAGKTKVTLYLTGLKEGYALGEPELTTQNILTQERDEITGKKEADGKYTFEMDLFSTSTGYIVCNDIFMRLVLNPGEDTEIYYDATAFSKRTSRYNPQPDLIFGGFNGGLSALNTQLLQYRDSFVNYNFMMYAYSDLTDPAIPDMDSEQYLDYMYKLYDEKVGKVEKSDLPDAMKQIVKSNLKSSLVNNIILKHRVYELNYRAKHKLGWDKPADVVFPKATEKDFLALKKINLNDPMWMYSDDFSHAVSNILNNKPANLNLKDLTGTESGFLQDMEKTSKIIRKGLLLEELTPDDEKKLSEASTPYYKEVYNRIFEKTKREKEEALAKGGFVIEPTPDVTADNILESIIAKYKGQAVFVDFWATWCGPCLGAMKTIKPVKPQMKEKGVVSIYISGETSPKGKWMNMLPDIGGIHYYLTDGQWDAMGKKYKIDGIPTYMIFDKSGKKVFETAGYPGNDKIMEELAKVW
jgi:thiol-disulfide isomerase/thioredoxin